MTTGIRTTHARAGEQSLTFSREFNAPATLVFDAHTDPDLFVHWMGPGGTHVQIRAFDARTGGEFDYVVVGMVTPSTTDGRSSARITRSRRRLGSSTPGSSSASPASRHSKPSRSSTWAATAAASTACPSTHQSNTAPPLSSGTRAVKAWTRTSNASTNSSPRCDRLGRRL